MGQIDHLVLQNFKSYGGKQIIGPFRKFTAVVGPNGAGKSNLMDAISFVLGMHAKDLRGQQLADLVHKPAGRERKPKSASVQLVYVCDINDKGRTDGEEIEFLRSINDEGVTAYKINGKKVKHKDYVDVLKSIGVIVAARNCLVFQGYVEAIAAKSPSELFELFEQVSGSDEYRKEYEMLAANKTTAEEDSVFTYRKKKGLSAEKHDVELQKREAEEYRQLLVDRETLRTKQMLWKLHYMQKSIEANADDESEKSDQVLSATGLLDKSTAEHKAAKKQEAKLMVKIGKAELAVESKRQELLVVDGELQKLHESKKRAETNLRDTTKMLTKIQKDQQDNEDQKKNLKGEIEKLELEAKAAEEEEDHGASETKMSESQRAEFDRLTAAAHSKTVKLRGDYDAMMLALEKEQAQENELKARETEYQNRREALEASIKHAESRIVDVKSSLAAKTSEMEKKQSALEKLDVELTQKQDRLKAVKHELEQAQDELNKMRHQDSMSEREALKERTLETLKKSISGIRGRLRDVCEPTDRKYNVAIEAALGKHLDAIVVDTAEAAKECIHHFRTHGVPPATFLPLDTLRVKRVDESFQFLGANYQLAVGLLKPSDPSVIPAIQYACGTSVICKTLKDAMALRYKKGVKTKCVSWDGSIVSKAGNMTGGTSSDAPRASRGWRRVNPGDMKDLRAKRDKLFKEMDILTRAVRPRGSASRPSIREEMDKIRQQLKILDLHTKHISTELDRNQDNIEKHKGELKTILEHSDALSEELLECGSKVTKLEKRIKETKSEISKIQDKIFRKFSKEIGVDNVHDFGKASIEAAAARMAHRREILDQITKLQQKLEYEESRDLSDQIKRVKKQIEKYKQEVKDFAAKAKGVKKVRTEKDDELDAAISHKARLSADLDTQSSEVKDWATQKSQAMSDLHKAEKKLDEIRVACKRLVAERHELLNQARVEQISLRTMGGYDAFGDDKVGEGKGSDADDGAVADDADDSDDGEDMDVASSKKGKSKKSKKGSKKSKSSTKKSKRQADKDGEGEAKGVDPVDDEEDDEETILERDNSIISSIEFELIEEHEKFNKVKSMDELDYLTLMCTDELRKISADLERLQPNMKAGEKLDEVSGRLEQQGKAYDEARENAREAADKFEAVRAKRLALFRTAFDKISANIDNIYKLLTASGKHKLGGKAHLYLTNEDDPFSGEGIKYSVMPPMKRFRDMDQMSGGEKTVAALSLLFAIHSFRPSPFFVMDEVDAALDRANILKVAHYLRKRTEKSDFQAVVISLKEELIPSANSLVGVYKKGKVSRTLTLDLDTYRGDGDYKDEGVTEEHSYPSSSRSVSRSVSRSSRPSASTSRSRS